ncbi:Clp protease N-terminal domain-containing protein [Cryptosporangium aurantiacum]|uniref:Clp amino terminal domain-containing protein, pathogenicity island component n=1 Tax=Cryptosporangium aurantiacum TaxID=134849 RepID=A0A1M7QNI9_9ACTN|nr:Clp protease N-terminal domain-containing protein [Cryptosporangium aurantiacum]SHN33056.1 Clp amino terminal domain-containing protein, pathogenicity island component [Cryptosporangium aurantiacum]
MFERFTKEARELVLDARDQARRLRHPLIGTEHLLLAMLAHDDVRANTVLRDAGLEYDRVRADIQRAVGTSGRVLTDEDAEALRSIGIDLDAVLASVERTLGPDSWPTPVPEEEERRGLFGRSKRSGTSRFAPRSKKVLELALREAIHLQSREINSDFILLGLIREGEGLGAKVIVDAGVNLDDLRRATLDHLKKAA